MRVIGTAGHVDHGKSTLVTALTGINPDRLKEEQEREMTIDLGFAWLALPSGEMVSLVDVPGHEAFIKNMLAGVGGIDAAMLVVAADEGIMPQTREHLAILDLLRVKGGVVALTKADLATEPGWIDLVRGEVENALKGTVLEGVSILPVSARTGQGLDDLKRELDRVLSRVAEKSDRKRPRLPIDRVFSIAGFGTVVTGTLGDGSLGIGDEVEIAPAGLEARVRGIQTHKEKLTRAAPGGRVALNLAGVATEQLSRGDVVILPGTYRPTGMLDAHIEWLESTPRPLAHNQELELFAFASQVEVRVRLLDGDELRPGASGWAQLVLAAPIVIAKGDRFILRYPSPSLTVGGGTVVDPHPQARHRRGRPEIIAQLARAEQGTPPELVLQYVEMHGPLEAHQLARPLGLDEPTTISAIQELVQSGDLLRLKGDRAEFLMTSSSWARRGKELVRLLADYHGQFPLRAGMPREEFKSRSALTPQVFEAALQQAHAEGLLEYGEKGVWRPDHQVRFEGALAGKVKMLLSQFGRTPYAPPPLVAAEAAVGAEALNALVEQGQLVRINEQVLLTPETERAMMNWVVQAIQEHGQVTAAELRDQFDTSRKYAIGFLEYLDQKRVTRRVGDARVLR
ncbi:MAG: selenocysteine-specific translation elongation factor [Anaerolineae bacterium]